MKSNLFKMLILILSFEVGITTANSQILRAGQGVENIIVGCSNADDLKKNYGEPSEITKAGIFEKYGYKNLGLDFYLHTSGRKTLSTIVVSERFKGETTDGFTLNSTRDGVYEKYGVPFNKTKNIFRKRVWVYDGIVFHFGRTNKNDTDLKTVEKIAITGRTKRSNTSPYGFEQLPVDCVEK